MMREKQVVFPRKEDNAVYTLFCGFVSLSDDKRIFKRNLLRRITVCKRKMKKEKKKIMGYMITLNLPKE